MARWRWLASIAAAWWFATQPAAAQGADDLAAICSGARLPFESPPFERFDRNDDDRLTSDEARSCETLAQIFTRLDVDADGGLTRAEYRSFADISRRRTRSFGNGTR